MKAVFGFQHISVHPRSVLRAGEKHTPILDDWQVSLLASYDFCKITPYLGVRWSRVDYTRWIDEADRKRRMSDLTKDIGLIVGFDVSITQKFWINLEGNFFDSEALAFSVNATF